MSSLHAPAGLQSRVPEASAQAVFDAWSALDWEQSVANATLPLAHYPQLARSGFEPDVQRALGRLFLCFTCELFIHFEGYLIDYLRRFPERVPLLSKSAIERFVREEELHTAAFRKLLSKLRSDLYPEGEPRFLQRRPSEDWVLANLSPVSFFLLAMLFEEITLFVPHVISQSASSECAELVRQVMDLHARDEYAHVGLDERVLRHICEKQTKPRSASQVLMTLPALWFLDRQVARGFRRLVAQACREHKLSQKERKYLLRRQATESDRLGTQSFIQKLELLSLPGGKLLSRALRAAIT